MQKSNKYLGIGILVALFCALAVFLIEDIRYKAPNTQFKEAVTLSENALDLNSAALEDLIELEGVGESTAQKILDFREKMRPFETVEDLLLIKGFGEKKLLKLLGMVYV